jgi:pimeloyl-ACP methyl ester carboxylesterase
MNKLKLRLCKERVNGETEYYVADAEGYEVRPIKGIDSLSRLNPRENLPPVAVWKNLNDKLQTEFSLEAFNYDWRKWGCPRFSRALPSRFKMEVERAYRRGGKGEGARVTLMGHSMGCPVILYCLGILGVEWQRIYLDQVLLVAPAMMGSVSMVPSYANNPLSATHAMFHAPEFLNNGVAATTRTWACMVAEMPMRVGGLNPFDSGRPIAKTSDRDYYVDDMGQFLEDLNEHVPGREFGAALWSSVQELASHMHAPAVPVRMIYNDEHATMAAVSYEQKSSLGDAPYVSETLQGDGTISLDSVESLGRQWREQGADVTLLNTPDQADHKNLIAGEYTVKTVLSLLKGEDIEERLSFHGSFVNFVKERSTPKEGTSGRSSRRLPSQHEVNPVISLQKPLLDENGIRPS